MILFLQLRNNEKAMEELRSSNLALQERLETMYRSMSMSPSQQQQQGALSLLNEMELSDSENHQNNNSKRSFNQIDEEVECDHPEDVNLSGLEIKEVLFYFNLNWRYEEILNKILSFTAKRRDLVMLPANPIPHWSITTTGKGPKIEKATTATTTTATTTKSCQQRKVRSRVS